MKYESTRGGLKNCTFKDALFSGYAPDGGLFIPQDIPTLSKETLEEWRSNKSSYGEILTKILRLFIDSSEVNDETLAQAVKKANEKFPPNVIEISQVGDLKIAELFHGPTASFKDLAFSLVAQLCEVLAERKKVVLIGTSGDTGSSAMVALNGLSSVHTIVLYPKGKVSRVQEMQILSKADNATVYAVEGTSDDLDVPIREAFPMDNLVSFNSINWARILVQIAHFVFLYLRREVEDEPLRVVVPTGAGGNIAGGIVAYLLNVPIELYSATNVNDAFHVFVKNGEIRFGGEITLTPANAMDIGFPYNVERILAFFVSREEVKEAMSEQSCISKEILENIKEIVKDSLSVPTDEIYKTMKECWSQHSYMLCPHTATGVYLANALLSGKKNVFVLATADPQKFSDSVSIAGIGPEEFDGGILLRKLEMDEKLEPKIMKRGEDWLAILLEEIKMHLGE